MSPRLVILLLSLSASPTAPQEVLLRRAIAHVALAQAVKMDPAWNLQERDCAGLVRFAYRVAFRELSPRRLWEDARGVPADFAQAETLLQHTFVLLGRDAPAMRGLKSGDLVAYRQEGDGAEPVFHLMLVIVPEDPAHGRARVVYHPGELGASVRTGVLDELAQDAPLAWRPVLENPAFLGFYRFKEWAS